MCGGECVTVACAVCLCRLHRQHTTKRKERQWQREEAEPKGDQRKRKGVRGVKCVENQVRSAGCLVRHLAPHSHANNKKKYNSTA